MVYKFEVGKKYQALSENMDGSFTMRGEFECLARTSDKVKLSGMRMQKMHASVFTNGDKSEMVYTNGTGAHDSYPIRAIAVI